MNRAEALRSIHDDLLEYIQKRVQVDFDNAMQAPVSFVLEGKKHTVREVLGRFRTQTGHHTNGFLVRVCAGNVYFLCFQGCETERRNSFHAGFWILSFRILSDGELMAFYREDRKMLVNMTLKRVADFHGHLCPDLVLGAKACEYGLSMASDSETETAAISVIAENCTSALDAIQIMLGCTVGNQRLQVMDFGKHNYTFLYDHGKRASRLTWKGISFGDEEEFSALAARIENGQVTLDEMVHFQSLLDHRVERLLALSPGDLFTEALMAPFQQGGEGPSTYLPCRDCGEPVLKSRIVHFKGGAYCTPCFQQTSTCCLRRRLQ